MTSFIKASASHDIESFATMHVNEVWNLLFMILAYSNNFIENLK